MIFVGKKKLYNKKKATKTSYLNLNVVSNG